MSHGKCDAILSCRIIRLNARLLHNRPPESRAATVPQEGIYTFRVLYCALSVILNAAATSYLNQLLYFGSKT